MPGEHAPFLLLAPCCVPQAHVKQIEVAVYESPEHRGSRLKQTAKRDRVVHAQVCRYCNTPGHKVAGCPELPPELSSEERTQRIHAAGAKAPCWRCGERGHQKTECTAPQAATRPKRLPRPSVWLEMSAVHAGRRQKISAVAGGLGGGEEKPEEEGESSENQRQEDTAASEQGVGDQLPPLPPFDAWVCTLSDVIQSGHKAISVVNIEGQFAGCHDERDWAGHRKCSWLRAHRG